MCVFVVIYQCCIVSKATKLSHDHLSGVFLFLKVYLKKWLKIRVFWYNMRPYIAFLDV